MAFWCLNCETWQNVGRKFALASPTSNSGGLVPLSPLWFRPVYVNLKLWVRLLGGCSSALKPSSSRSCYPPCDAEHSFCTDDDRCVCRPSYRPVYKHRYLVRCLSTDDVNQQSYLVQPELDADPGTSTQPVHILVVVAGFTPWPAFCVSTSVMQLYLCRPV